MIKVNNITQMEEAFKAKAPIQTISFDIINRIGKVKPVNVVITYSKQIDKTAKAHFYYKVCFKKESIAFTFVKTKREALDFIIDEAKRLGWKDKLDLIDFNTLDLNKKSYSDIKKESVKKVNDFFDLAGWKWPREKRYDKLLEELQELEDAYENNDLENIKEEIWDLYFTYVGLIKKINRNNDFIFSKLEETEILKELSSLIKKDIKEDMIDLNKQQKILSFLNDLASKNDMTLEEVVSNSINKFKKRDLGIK